MVAAVGFLGWSLGPAVVVAIILGGIVPEILTSSRAMICTHF